MVLTTQDLTNLLKRFQEKREERDFQQYRYVIYARKSSDEKERQVRSLGDQITECKKFAEVNKLKTINPPITESESAKEPDIRARFREMLEKIKKGEYDGIISWHPDRLARNMKDAGEIIDLLDKEIVKDLKFVSFTFENTTAGKMLLGIAFVISKQYSDKLSDDVKRGMRSSIIEGKWLNKAKHGYYKDRNQFLRPDGDNFTLIKSAWKMRLQNKTLDEIALYLNKNKYSVPIGIGGDKHEIYKMDKKRLSELFRDTFYTGVLKYGDTITNLTEIYDFVPMLEVDEFLKVNKFDTITKALKQKIKASQEGSVKADLLRGRVICGYCSNPMVAGITSKKHQKGITNYFYYRCDSPRCKFKGKSVRANVIVNFAYKYLDDNKFTSKEIYDHYIKEMKRVIDEQEIELDTRKRSLLTEKRKLEDKIEKTKDYLLNSNDEFIRNTFEKELKEKEQNLINIVGDIEKIKETQNKNKDVIYSYTQFLELLSNLADRIRQTKELKQKDYLLSKIFLNFTVKDRKVLSYQLNSPFKEFVEKGFVVSSRDLRKS